MKMFEHVTGEFLRERTKAAKDELFRKQVEGKVDEILEFCLQKANLGYVGFTYSDSYMVPEVVQALHDRGITVDKDTGNRVYITWEER
jgi:hypothetical protein